MNILFVSAVLPYPLHSGGQVRIYNLLKRLGKKHTITLVSFIRDESERTLVSHLDFCNEVHMVMRGRAWQPKYVFSAVFGKYPFLLATYDNKAMKNKISELLATNTFDLVHAEPFYVWPSLPPTKLPIVVSEHNVEYEVYQEYAKRLPFMFSADITKLKTWEQTIWKKATAVTAVSESDRLVMQPFAGKNTAVVSNGVDIDDFSFAPKKTISSTSLKFLYVGAYRWIQNRDAIEYLMHDIWPAIRAKYPAAVLCVVGKKLPEKDGVVSFESVLSIQEEYRKADILLAPIRVGGGTKYKILESMAMGLPVITTDVGAQGMNIHDGKEVWIAQTPPEIVRAIEDIVDGASRRNILSNARKLVETDYSWDRIASVLDTVWKK